MQECCFTLIWESFFLSVLPDQYPLQTQGDCFQLWFHCAADSQNPRHHQGCGNHSAVRAGSVQEGEPGSGGGTGQEWGSGPTEPQQELQSSSGDGSQAQAQPSACQAVPGGETDPRSAQGLKSTGQGADKQGTWPSCSCRVAQQSLS